MIMVFPNEPQNFPKTRLFESNSCLKLLKPMILLFRIFSHPIASVRDVLNVKKIGYSWKIRNTMKKGAIKK